MARVALSSLRVTSDFDASGYVRGAAQKVDADNKMIASDKARNAALAQSDAALAKIPGGMTSVSKALLDGYGAGAQFEAIIRRIGNAADRGMGLDRVNLLLDAAYQKFGLTADAASLAEKGFVSISGAVTQLNEQYSVHAEVATRAAAAIEQLAAAQKSQAAINSTLGIGGDTTKSAQESADAFMAQYGGLAGVARAQAEEAGKAFSQDLDQLMIAGAAKSAKDSASVFDQNLRQLDEIATQRAQQAGANFQRSLTEALGGGGAAATSLGATYEALAAEMQRLDQIDQARAAHVAQSTQQAIAQAYGFDQVTKSARASAAAFMEIDAAGAALAAEFDEAAAAEQKAVAAAEQLRAQLNPLQAEMINLGKQTAAYRQLLNDGVISTSEYEQAQVLLAKRLTDVQMQLKNTSSTGRVASGELVNLSYQLNDVVTGLALGQSPFMILAQQGGQVFQIFQSSKASISDFASTIGSKFLGLLSVSRVAWGGIAAAVGLGIAALISYQSKQSEVQRSLLGAGRASGATVGSINSIADAGASRTGLSVNEARELATALAQTGKVANDNILPIVKMGKDIATVYGTDAAEAAKMLADAFADPVKGADDLNQRLGFLDGATKQLITNLVAQNNVYAAQVVLANAVKTSLLDVSATVSTTKSAWTALGNAVSNAWDSIGKSIYNVLNPLQGLDAQLDAAKRKLDLLQKTGGRTVDPDTGMLGAIADPAAIAAAQAQIEKLTAALQRQKTAADDARNAQQSLAQQQAIRTALPQIAQTQDLQNQLKLLQDLAAAPDVDQKLAKVGQSMDQLQRSIVATSAALAAIPKNALVDFLGNAASPAERLAAGLEQIRAKSAQINASPTDTSRATSALQLDIASSVQSARMSALGQSAGVADSVKQKFLELQRAQEAGAGLTAKQIQDQLALARAQADGSLQIKAQVDATTIQTATIGMSAGAAAEYTAKMTALADAVRNHKELTDQDKAAIDAQAKALGAAAQANALKQIQNDIRFGRQTALLSPDDVQIAQQLKSVYPDVATALASVEAQALRTNAAIGQASSTISSDLVTGITDALDGTKSFGQAFSDTSKLVIRAIEEMIIKLLVVGPLMRSLQSSFSGLGDGADFGSLLGSAGVSFGSPGTAGSNLFGPVAPSALGNAFARGNIIPFARGGVVTRPTLFPMANGGTGLMGEAGEEAVMPLRRGPDGRLGVSAGGLGGAANDNSASGNVVVNIYNAPSGSDPQTSVSRTNNGSQVDIVFKNAVTGLMVDDAAKNGPISQAISSRQRGFGS
ncbi:phage tail length tape measure family protein [Bradyrhizobium sp. 41S5]|uniref:phage tail length tape measure family protein n=1 Tax=Bradyrhizobium sp. 41S5 TaxID=1404443 RepID=UPI00156AC776